MATTTPNYGWTVPTSSDLVKNGATAIETLGDSVDDALWSSGFGQAGKNKIINGDFGIWQRGTSFNSPSATFCADRFSFTVSGGSGTPTVTQQTFTAGTAPVAGYEGTFYPRINTATSATYFDVLQKIENVRTFAGQIVTFSFWAKASATTSAAMIVRQNFGSGGSANVDTIIYPSITTSWQRFTMTVNTLGSMTGKTIGANSYLMAGFFANGAPPSGVTIDTWGWQLEYGSKATPFQLAGGGDPQSELALCQRYYWRANAQANYSNICFGYGATTGIIQTIMNHPVQMRTTPTSIDYLNIAAYDGLTVYGSVTSIGINTATLISSSTNINYASGIVVGKLYSVLSNNTTNSYIGFSAEL